MQKEDGGIVELRAGAGNRESRRFLAVIAIVFKDEVVPETLVRLAVFPKSVPADRLRV